MNTFTHTSRKPLRTILTVAAAVALLATGARADEVPQVHVKYAELNVATEAGAQVLYQRILRAADQVCGTAEVRDFTLATRVKGCRDRAVAEAVAAVNAPKLTAVYVGKTGIVSDRIKLAAQ